MHSIYCIVSKYKNYFITKSLFPLTKNSYWNDRYNESTNDSTMSEPFDWLFSFHEVKFILNHLLPKKDVPALLIGCGNAPFSIDM